MARKKEKDTKRRIFEAAVKLIARKGYHAVGVREIAKAAGVNVSAIFYYFGEKIGILEAIVNEAYDKYHRAVLNVGDENTPLEERVRIIVRNLVDFFRNNTELAMVAFNSLPVDIPQIMNLKVKWLCGDREQEEKFFRQLGVDTSNDVQTSVVCGSVSSSILSHFQSRYILEYILRAPDQSPETLDYLRHICVSRYGNAFYDRYSEMLSELFLRGLTSVVAHDFKKRRDGTSVKRQKRRNR